MQICDSLLFMKKTRESIVTEISSEMEVENETIVADSIGKMMAVMARRQLEEMSVVAAEIRSTMIAFDETETETIDTTRAGGEENRATETVEVKMAVGPGIAPRDPTVDIIPTNMEIHVVIHAATNTNDLVGTAAVEIPSIAPDDIRQTLQVMMTRARVTKNQGSGRRAFKKTDPPLTLMFDRQCFTSHCRIFSTTPRASCTTETRNAPISVTTKKRIHPLSKSKR